MSIAISTSIGSVTLEECFENYLPGIDLTRGPYIEKVYLCPSWPSFFPVINALMGIGTTPTPHACPESPNLRCVDARGDPRAELDARDSGRPRFNLPLVHATYGLRTWEAQASDDPGAVNSFPNEIDPGQPYVFMEQSIDFDSEVVKLPGRAFVFADNTPNDTPAAKTVGTATFTLVRRWQGQLPYANFAAYLNKLNNATFLGQPKGQIKFRKGRTRRQFTSDGTTTQEVELAFQWREADHNKVFRPDTGAFDMLQQANFVGPGSAPGPYSYADLTQLLR